MKTQNNMSRASTSVPLTPLTFLCCLMTLAAGCNGTTQMGTMKSLRFVDATTGKPIAAFAGVSLVTKTPWHPWDDPDETPFGDWRVARIQVLDGRAAQLWLPDDSSRGSIFVAVQHKRRGAVLFAPGYVPGFYGYISIQFRARDSTAVLSLAATLASRPAQEKVERVPTYPLIPLGVRRARATMANAQVLQVRREKLSFLLNQEAMWSDLADHYRAGRDVQAIKLVCECVVLMIDSLSNEHKTAVTGAHQKTVTWCLKVSRG